MRIKDIIFLKLREKDCQFSYLSDFYMIRQIAHDVDLQSHYDISMDTFSLFPQYISPHMDMLINSLLSHGYFNKD